MADIQAGGGGGAAYPSWALIFPEWCVAGGTSRHEYARLITRTQAPQQRRRIALWKYPRTVLDLSDILLWETKKNEIEAFLTNIGGKKETFLFFDTAFCQIDDELQMLGDGTTDTFYLRKRWFLTYAEAVADWRIRYPDHNYPVLTDISGAQIRGTRLITITVDGTPTTDFTIDRQSGLVTMGTPPADGVEVRASGYFYQRVRLNQNGIPITSIGGSDSDYDQSDGMWYEIASGVAMIEPKSNE